MKYEAFSSQVGIVDGSETSGLVVALDNALGSLAAIATTQPSRLRGEEWAVEVHADGESFPGYGLERLAFQATCDRD